MTTLAALIPAAGCGTRLGHAVPKQFLEIAGATVLEHAVAAVAADPRVMSVTVVLPPAGVVPAGIAERVTQTVSGGDTRAASVVAGIAAIVARFASVTHVLIHDAARPCLHPHDLAAVIDAALEDEQGAILAARVTDTVKRGHERIDATLERAGLWLAQTPQIFPLKTLDSALRTAGDVTDDAGAMERAGFRPRLVAARFPNPKITWPEDLRLARALLPGSQS